MTAKFLFTPVLVCVLSAGAQAPVAQAVTQTVSQTVTQTAASVARLEGVDAPSGISWVMLTAQGTVTATGAVPHLTAQCTKTTEGKLRFEVLTDAGADVPLAFVAPWKASKDSLFEPPFDKVRVKMEFLGYVKVKPDTRQWRGIPELPGELKYSTPGMSSTNMEEVTYYMQYLRSLPTLRLTIPGKPLLEFNTAKWQEAIRKEPLCHASSL